MREVHKVFDDLVPVLVVLYDFWKPLRDLELGQRVLDDGLAVLDERFHDQIIGNFLSTDGTFAVPIAALDQTGRAKFVTTLRDAVILFGQLFKTDGTFPRKAT